MLIARPRDMIREAMRFMLNAWGIEELDQRTFRAESLLESTVKIKITKEETYFDVEPVGSEGCGSTLDGF